MTTREWAATKKYESLNSEEKERLEKNGILGLKTRFCSSLQSQISQIEARLLASQIAVENEVLE